MILLVFWYNLLLIYGLERTVRVTLVCHFTMHLVSSCRRKRWPHSVFSQTAQSHCFCRVRSVSQLRRSSLIQQKIFFVGLSLQQPNRQTWAKGLMTDRNTWLEVVRTGTVGLPFTGQDLQMAQIKYAVNLDLRSRTGSQKIFYINFNCWAISCCCPYWFWGTKGSVFIQI